MKQFFKIILYSVILTSTILFSNDINLVEHYNELGVKNLDRIKQGLSKNGILKSQINPVLRGMTRVIKVVKVEGYDFEMDQRMKMLGDARPWERRKFFNLKCFHTLSLNTCSVLLEKEELHLCLREQIKLTNTQINQYF